MDSREKGFSVIELIMVVVIIILIGAVVYFYLQANQKRDQSGVAVTASVSPSPTASTPSVPPLNNNSVKATVTSFYSDYLRAVNGSGQTSMDAVVAKYGTAAFVSYYAGIMHGNEAVAGDPVVCINGTANNPPEVTDIKFTSDKLSANATVRVLESITPIVIVVNNDGPKIDRVSCSR